MYAIDIGNGFTLSYNGKNTVSVRSALADLHSLANKRPGEGVVTYNGKHYHTGADAFRYDMHRSLAITDKQLNGNLVDALILTLNVISPARGKLEEQTPIVVQVPNLTDAYHHELVKMLNGHKCWTLDGKSWQTTLKVQGVYQEGFGSWYMAYRANTIPKGGYSIVVDVGAGTVISSLIDNSSGEVYKTFSYAKSGVIYLANLIAGDIELRMENDNCVIRPEQLFLGIEDGSYRLGTTGVNFKSYVDFYSYQWWKHIWTNVVSSYNVQLDRREVSRVLVTGGGAEIARKFVEAASAKPGFSFFSMASNPLTDNVVGIYRHAEDHKRQ